MNRFKQLIFALIFSVFFYILIQDLFHVVNIRPLYGSYEKAVKPKYSVESWLSGNYQDSLTHFIQKNLYVSPDLIRLRNEIGFVLFKEMHVNGSEIGKENYLFESGYIYAHLGLDYVGDGIISEKTRKLAYIQTELEKRNITLLFVIAPSKASYYPEFIPEKYNSIVPKKSNYDEYVRQFQNFKINYLDISEYFLALKPYSKAPLYTQTGIHWSGYGATLAADTLFKEMEKIRNIDIQDYFYEEGTRTSYARGTDNDLEKAMNLINKIQTNEMYYPKLKIKYDSHKVRPNVLIVGDSFVWSWIGFYNYFPELLDDRSAFWFYNRELAWTKRPEPLSFPLDTQTLSDQIKARDYILIVNNRWALNQCGNDFIEQMYDLLIKKEY